MAVLICVFCCANFNFKTVSILNLPIGIKAVNLVKVNSHGVDIMNVRKTAISIAVGTFMISGAAWADTYDADVLSDNETYVDASTTNSATESFNTGFAASFNNLPFETSTLQLLGLFTTS